MDKVIVADQANPCPKCDSQKWIINNQGNQTCTNCGYICSFGYITYEDEVFNDSENPSKNLSRFSRNDGKLNLGLSFSDQDQKKSSDIEDKEEYLILLFSNCLKLMPYYTPKDIYCLKQSIVSQWNDNLDAKTKQNAIAFVYNFFFNEWRQYFDIDSQEDLQISLKTALNIKLTHEIKSVCLENKPRNDELFYQLMISLYPQLSEEQYETCLLRLENLRNKINCNKTTYYCVSAYDSLLNYLHCKKVDLKQLVTLAHTIFDVKGTCLKENTVLRVYKQSIKNTSQKSNKYTI